METSFEAMALAVNCIAEIQGRQVLVNKEAVVYEIAYPVVGLLSDLDACELAEEKKKLNARVHELGCTLSIPFMFLSFICLAVIPEYAITGHGFIDVMQQKIIGTVLEMVK